MVLVVVVALQLVVIVVEIIIVVVVVVVVRSFIELELLGFQAECFTFLLDSVKKWTTWSSQVPRLRMLHCLKGFYKDIDQLES